MCDAWQWATDRPAGSQGTPLFMFYTSCRSCPSKSCELIGGTSKLSVCDQAPEEKLDVLGAESEGRIGYLLETELSNELQDAEVMITPNRGSTKPL